MRTLRATLTKQLEKLGVREKFVPGRVDGFSSLCYGGKDFAHFHNDSELDVHLTKAIISREGLKHPANSTVHPKRSPNSPWIEIPLTTPAELKSAVRLITLAMELVGKR